ncbi:MAG: diguanylate cyclase [Pirellulales bacterium]|nr:diguanylate cyclase [Pirellulales bacterium]
MADINANPLFNRVLVVDDQPECLRLHEEILTKVGYEVFTADSAKAAIEISLATAPNFLITDWMMPEMDGLELCQYMRGANLPNYLYMIIVTVRTGANDVVEGLAAGADEFLRKPVDRAELVARMRSGERLLRMEQCLRENARRDALTGLPSRRAFNEDAEREFQRARRYRSPLSCVVMDVDHFKRINDVHGHGVGDAVLCRLGEALRTSRRNSDLVCRYGGEEFCALLPETGEEAAAGWTERVRRTIHRLEIPVDDLLLRVSASFGVAELLDDCRSVSQLFDAADQSLLVAKQSGRNRVVCYKSLVTQGTISNISPNQEDPFAGVTAENVMSTLVASLNTTDTLQHAAEFFLRFRVNAAPVVDGRGKLVGVLSEKDVMTKMASAEGWDMVIGEAMNANVVCYSKETPVRVIHDFLCRVAIRRVIIVDQGYPLGIIGRGTLLGWYQNWLAIRRPKAEKEDASHRITTREGFAATADAISHQAKTIRQRINRDNDEFVPTLIDGATRIQELVKDLLVATRWYAGQEAQTPGN